MNLSNESVAKLLSLSHEEETQILFSYQQDMLEVEVNSEDLNRFCMVDSKLIVDFDTLLDQCMQA